MFTPMNGRRSLFKRSNECTYDPLNIIAIEGIRFFIHYNQNTSLDTFQYWKNIKNSNPIVKTIMKHIIQGTKKLGQ